MMVSRFWLRTILSVGACALAVRGVTSPARAQGQSQDALDTARKDLEELPSTVTTPSDATKSLDTGKLDLVIPANGASPNGGAIGTQKPDQAVSQGWLLDALTKNSGNLAPDRSGSTQTNRGFDRRQGKLDTTVSAETARAWTPLLQSWIQPQNRALIPTVFTANGSAQQNGFGSPQNSSATASTNGNVASSAPAEWLTGDATYHDPLAQRTNPYLETNTAASAGSTEFHLPRLTAPFSSSPSLTIKSGDEAEDSLYPTTGDSKAAPRRDDQIQAPTAPVVNQQKYFPQLDRF